jgi:hypothetical protein
MRRLLLLLALAAVGAPAFAQQRSMTQITAADCAATACTATSAPYCAQGTVLNVCDTGTGFYVAVASGSLVGDPVTITGSLAISTAGGGAGAIDLEEAAPGTNVGTFTVGDLTAARTYTFPDASGTIGIVPSGNARVLYSCATGLCSEASLGYNAATDALTLAGALNVNSIVATAGASFGSTVAVTSGGVGVTGASSIAGNLTVTSGDVSVASGQGVYLDPDTRLTQDADTGFVLVYRDGALRATITGNGVIPGACGSDLWAMELGSECIDTTGRRISVGTAGPIVLTGSVP